eukprot:CAMPEP_0195630824 /NCGR_PEP_ID=MMETSP0815-20121206/20754_1 /TAXON_ID=97485 /ORGANISM="Prymnesium parvum, Strain Texoma1" /LENGTH=69 /DNA_ID=CAMNT_0040772317 /DNA_START=19 /DNA_END=225 /DNA_ORIENTATION=-
MALLEADASAMVARVEVRLDRVEEMVEQVEPAGMLEAGMEVRVAAEMPVQGTAQLAEIGAMLGVEASEK